MPTYNLNDIVTNESQTVTVVNNDTYHTLIPLYGPFFKDSLNLVHVSSSGVVTPQVPGVDFNFALMWISASRVLNDILYGAVTIQTPKDNGYYRFNSYKTAGSQWSVPINQVYSFLVNNAYNPRIASWEQVVGEPALYPPTPHTQPLSDFKGYDELILAIDRMANHVMSSPALSAHNTDPNAHITNIVSSTDIDIAVNNLINGDPIDSSVADKPITLKYLKEFLIRANIVDYIGGGDGSNLATKQDLLDHNTSSATHGDIRSLIGSAQPGSTFTLTSNSNTVLEGGSIVLNLVTDGIPNGTQYVVRSKSFIQNNKPFIQTLESFYRFSYNGGAYDRTNEVVWLPVIGTRIIVKYDIATNSFIGVIKLDHSVMTYQFNQSAKLILNTNLNRLYISNNEYHYINLNDIDFSINTSVFITPTISLFNYWNNGNIYNSTKNSYWIYGGTSIYRRDATTGTLLATYDFMTVYDYIYAQINALTYDSRNNSIWVTLVNNNSVIELNADTLVVKRSRVVSLYNPPDLLDIVYDHINNRLWTYQLLDSGVAQLYIIDAVTGDDIKRFTLGHERLDIVYDEVNDCMWIFSYAIGKLYKLDAKTADILGMYSSGPAFINPDTYYSYSLNCLVQINGGINREVGLISKFDVSALPDSTSNADINLPVAPNDKITINNNTGSLTIPVPLNTVIGSNKTVVFEVLNTSGLAVATSSLISIIGINNPLPPNTNVNSLLSMINRALSSRLAKSHYLANIN